MKFTDFVFKTNIIGLRSYLKYAPDSNKARINDVIKLYEERKIRNIKTAINLIDLLNSASTNEKTLKQYNKLSSSSAIHQLRNMYQIEERGNPNSLEYRLFIRK